MYYLQPSIYIYGKGTLVMEFLKLCASALITACATLLGLYLKRKWEKQDQTDENKKSVEDKIDKLSKNVSALEDKIDDFSNRLNDYTARNDKEVGDIDLKTRCVQAGLREMLYDRIKHLCKKYIGETRIREEDYKSLTRMWQVYHEDLGGNGYLDGEMKEVDSLEKY